MKLDVISYEKIDKLTPSGFNPPQRTEAQNLTDLIESMQRDGFHWYDPIKVTDDMHVGDGHRRLAAAKTLGIDSVPILVIRGKTASDIWAESEDGKRVVTGGDVIRATSNGLSRVPKRHKRIMEQIEKIGGRKLIDHMAKNNKSVGVFKQAVGLAGYCSLRNDNAFVLAAVYWLIDHNMTRMARLATDLHVDPRRIEVAIRDDRALKIS